MLEFRLPSAVRCEADFPTDRVRSGAGRGLLRTEVRGEPHPLMRARMSTRDSARGVLAVASTLAHRPAPVLRSNHPKEVPMGDGEGGGGGGG